MLGYETFSWLRDFFFLGVGGQAWVGHFLLAATVVQQACVLCCTAVAVQKVCPKRAPLGCFFLWGDNDEG